MMNKKVLSLVLTVALILTLVMPTMAEKWGPDEFNLNLAFYSCEANGELKTTTTGSYILGDFFYFQYDLWINGVEGKKAVYKINLKVDNGVNAVEIKDFQYYNGTEWVDGTALRGSKEDTEPLKTLTINNSTRYRVRFMKNTTYMVEASCVGENNEFGVASTRYIVLGDGKYQIFREGSVEELTTVEPVTEEPSTEELSTEEPSTEEPVTEELSTEELSTEEPSTEELSTEEPSTEELSTEEPSTEELSTEEPSTKEPSTEELSTAEPTTVEVTTKEIITSEQTTKEVTTAPKSGLEPGADESDAEKAILNLKNDNDPEGSIYNLLQLKQKSTKKKSIKVGWKKVKGAKKYVIYGNRCGLTRRYKKITSTKKTSYVHKKLKKGTYYKFMVVAVDANNKVITVSKLTHITTKGGKKGNDKAVKVNAKKVTLKVSKTFKLKAKEIPQSKKLRVSRHRVIKYESDNPKVASVDGKGAIKGVTKGKCNVYVYAQNGLGKKIKVIVK